jgi:hypothetical protein
MSPNNPQELIIPVTITTTNFTLMAPGSCGSMTDCGHVHVLIDGSACTPDGAPYNNDGTTDMFNAIVSSCPMVKGSHTITTELHHDDHSAFLGANMMVIEDSVTVMVTAADGG